MRKSSSIKNSFLLMILTAYASFGQSVGIDTLKITVGPRSDQELPRKLHFPIIHSANKDVDSTINAHIKNVYTEFNYERLTTESALQHFLDLADGIDSIDFEITLNQAGLLSLIITTDGCANFCTTIKDYYTYSTLTGQRLFIDDVIDLKSPFVEKVIKEKDIQYDFFIMALGLMRRNPELIPSPEVYAFVLDVYKRCDLNFSIREFYLHKDYLEIISRCGDFPNHVKHLTPAIDLKFRYSDVGTALKLNIKE